MIGLLRGDWVSFHCLGTRESKPRQRSSWSINDRDRVNFDQVAGGQRRYAEHHVRWLVISEQRYPAFSIIGKHSSRL